MNLFNVAKVDIICVKVFPIISYLLTYIIIVTVFVRELHKFNRSTLCSKSKTLDSILFMIYY